MHVHAAFVKKYCISSNIGEHYLAVCLENAVGRILNYQILVLYGEKPMLVVYNNVRKLTW